MRKDKLGLGVFLSVLSVFIIYVMIICIKTDFPVKNVIKTSSIVKMFSKINRSNIIVYDYNSSDYDDDSYSYGNTNNLFTFDEYEVPCILCEMVSEDVRITETSDSKISVFFKGNWKGTEPYALISGNTLVINKKYRKNYTGPRTVEISIPNSWDKDISISLSSGDAIVDKNNIGNLSINTISGNQLIKVFNAKSVNCSSSSGDVKINSLKSDYVNLGSISGDLSFSNIETLSFNASSTSGDIQGDISAESFEINSISGDSKITLKKNLSNTSSINSTSGNINITNCSDYSYKYITNTRSGSTRIKDYSKNKSDVTVNADSISGNIYVN